MSQKSREIGIIGVSCPATLQISVYQLFSESSCSKESAIGYPIAILTDHLPHVHKHEVDPSNRYSSQLPEIIKLKAREYFRLPVSPRDWRALMKDYCRDKLRDEMEKTRGWAPDFSVTEHIHLLLHTKHCML